MSNRMLYVGLILSIIFCISEFQSSESVSIAAEINKDEQVQEQLEEYDYYEELIAVAGECAAKSNGEKPENYDFSSVIYMRKDWDYGTLGYLVTDIDGNGTDELIFGGNADESVSWYDGIIYDIYTISNGELVHILDGWERSRYFLCENGMIAHEGVGSAFNGINSYFTLKGDELYLVESVMWNYEGADDACIYYYTIEPEPVIDNADIISAEQAGTVMDKYVYEHIAFIPFAENLSNNNF